MYNVSVKTKTEGKNNMATLEDIYPVIDMMKVSVFMVELEGKLQSMSTRPGGDLLTTWLSIDDFLTMISDDESDLTDTVNTWKDLGANEVYIDGFKMEAVAA